jgi:hypothetical protein
MYSRRKKWVVCKIIERGDATVREGGNEFGQHVCKPAGICLRGPDAPGHPPSRRVQASRKHRASVRAFIVWRSCLLILVWDRSDRKPRSQEWASSHHIKRKSWWQHSTSRRSVSLYRHEGSKQSHHNEASANIRNKRKEPRCFRTNRRGTTPSSGEDPARGDRHLPTHVATCHTYTYLSISILQITRPRSQQHVEQCAIRFDVR